MGNTINKRLKEIKANIESAFTTVTNNTFINEIKNQINTLTTNTTNSNANITKMIVEASFSNLPPKIGYLDETTVPMNANFNMSFSGVNAGLCFVTSDLEGREVTYFRGAQDGAQSTYFYRAYRNNINNNTWTFDNEPVNLKTVLNSTDNIFINHIVGISNDYLIVRGSNNVMYHINTNYTSNVKNWKIVREISWWSEPITTVIYFAENDKYLCSVRYSQSMGLRVYNGDGTQFFEDKVFDLTKIHHSKHPEWATSFSEYGGQSCGVAYVSDIKQLVIMYRFYPNIVKKSNGYLLYNGDAGPNGICVNILESFDYTKLNTKNCFKNAKWYTPDNLEYDMDRWGWVDSTDGAYAWNLTHTHRGTEFIQYDSLNKQLYHTHGIRDDTGAMVYRTPLKNIQLENGITYFCKYATVFKFDAPDASPWAKQTFAPTVIYNSFILQAQSQKYGSGDGSYANGSNGCATLINPVVKDGNTYQVEAGSWLMWKESGANTIWKMDSNYSCTKENFNSKDGVSWYKLVENGNYLEVRRLDYKSRKANNGKTYNDFIYCPDGYVARFKKPSTVWAWAWNCGGKWAFHHSSFGGGNKLIFFAQMNGNRECEKVSGKYQLKDAGCMPRFIILSEDGNISHVQMPQNWQDWWLGAACDDWAYLRGIGDSGRNSFLDSDGRTFYIHTQANWNGGSYCFIAWRVTFNSALTAVEEMTQIGQGDGTWCGKQCIGWNKIYGYYYGWSPRNASYLRYTTTSMTDAIQGSANQIGLTNGGSVGLITYVQSFPIFLGGYFSVVPAQEIYLQANKTNYIYLARDLNDYRKVNVEVYNKLLGTENKSNGINFQRILVTKIVCDDKGPISQEYYHIQYYGQ